MPQELWIASASTWEQHAPRLANESVLAVDLEGDFMLYRYGRRICLYQLAFENGDIWLIDPLAGFSLDKLFQAFSNPSQIKVFWGASNDVRYLKALAGCRVQGLVDLWEAAKLILHPRPSLAMVLQETLGVTIAKEVALQTSDWNTRPLSEEQRRYAAQDVRYLLPVWQGWKATLTGALATVFQKRMNHLLTLEVKPELPPLERIKGRFLLTPDELERLKHLAEEREIEAQRRDLAPWRLAENDKLLAWAKAGQTHAWET